ncbi:MAG: radical SAM protein [Kiritimatiellae bacterium]|nr:radical SAM protein [Kiritimatiellia bacterium]
MNRLAGERGCCGETAACRLASIGVHYGEEPAISGSKGSGTLFFSGCSCGCFFCQNHQISRGGLGEVLEMDRLFERVGGLIAEGVHNLNFVTPDHFWPHVEQLVRRLRADGCSIPFLYNGSGYQRPDLIERYAESFELFLPDFKFLDASFAELCMGDPAYGDIALEAIRRMVECRGFLRPFDESGFITAQEGVLVRHLVMPGHANESCAILKLLHREFGSGLPLSVMSQFTPVPECTRRNSLNRRLCPEEYRQVVACVEGLGFEHVYLQEGFGDDDFLPDFKEAEPFEGNRRNPVP